MAITAGFIGLGSMGAPMAANLLKAGYRLIVNDLRQEAAATLLASGAAWADSPRDVARGAEVIFSCLPGLAAVEEVALGSAGVLAGVQPGQAYFEMSTGSVELAKRIHDAFAERGAHMLEAPISGGAPGARRGQLAIWVGGDETTYRRYESVLRAMGDGLLHIGPIGAALTTKLIHSCASAAIQASIAEIFVLGVKAGASPIALWEALRQGAVGRRRSFDGLIDQYLPRRFDDPHAALRIVYKDVLLATGLARDLGVPLRISNLALADLTEAMNRGWAERDARSVMLLPQERAGVQVAVDPRAIQAVMERDPPAPTDTKHGAGSMTPSASVVGGDGSRLHGDLVV